MNIKKKKKRKYTSISISYLLPLLLYHSLKMNCSMNVIFDIEKNMKKFFTSVQNVLGMNKIKEIYFETQATMGLSEILLCHEKKSCHTLMWWNQDHLFKIIESEWFRQKSEHLIKVFRGNRRRKRPFCILYLARQLLWGLRGIEWKKEKITQTSGVYSR